MFEISFVEKHLAHKFPHETKILSLLGTDWPTWKQAKLYNTFDEHFLVTTCFPYINFLVHTVLMALVIKCREYKIIKTEQVYSIHNLRLVESADRSRSCQAYISLFCLFPFVRAIFSLARYEIDTHCLLAYLGHLFCQICKGFYKDFFCPTITSILVTIILFYFLTLCGYFYSSH